MKKRLDTLVFEKGLATTRARAKALIMEGVISVDRCIEDKAGALFNEECKIELTSNPLPFVSRGGLKIQKALDVFGITVENLVCMDVGASTGGFTDCLLQRGAKMVYSIDVGYGQLDYRLRCDERVAVMERTNIRKVEPNSLHPRPQFACADVSFISLKKVLPAMEDLMEEACSMVLLIKPQFEAGKEKVGKGGVVRDREVHRSVVEDMADFFADKGYSICGLSFSPVKGPKGNIEYLIYITRDLALVAIENIHKKIEEVITASHEELDK